MQIPRHDSPFQNPVLGFDIERAADAFYPHDSLLSEDQLHDRVEFVTAALEERDLLQDWIASRSPRSARLEWTEVLTPDRVLDRAILAGLRSVHEIHTDNGVAA